MRQWAVPTRALPAHVRPEIFPGVWAFSFFRFHPDLRSSGRSMVFPSSPEWRPWSSGFLGTPLVLHSQGFLLFDPDEPQVLACALSHFSSNSFCLLWRVWRLVRASNAILRSILPLLFVQAMSSYLREALRGRHFLALAAFFSWMEPCVVLYTDFSDTWSVPWTPSGTKCCSHFTIGCGICHAGATSAPHSEVFCSLSSGAVRSLSHFALCPRHPFLAPFGLPSWGIAVSFAQQPVQGLLSYHRERTMLMGCGEPPTFCRGLSLVLPFEAKPTLLCPSHSSQPPSPLENLDLAPESTGAPKRHMSGGVPRASHRF